MLKNGDSMENRIEDLLYKTTLKDNDIRYEALNELLLLTEKRVVWYNDHIDDILLKLQSKNAFQRSIGMMLICNLAKSDTENRTKAYLPKIIELLSDDKIMVKRQTIQNIWKIAISTNELETEVINLLISKYLKCINEKHYNLVRADILESLLKINNFKESLCPINKIKELIDLEQNISYSKSYKKLLNK